MKFQTQYTLLMWEKAQLESKTPPIICQRPLCKQRKSYLVKVKVKVLFHLIPSYTKSTTLSTIQKACPLSDPFSLHPIPTPPPQPLL